MAEKHTLTYPWFMERRYFSVGKYIAGRVVKVPTIIALVNLGHGG